MKHHPTPLAAAAALTVLLAACATPLAPSATPIDINLVALNDFHGNLDRSKFTYTSAADAGSKTVQAGGIDTLSGALTAWRRSCR